MIPVDNRQEYLDWNSLCYISKQLICRVKTIGPYEL